MDEVDIVIAQKVDPKQLVYEAPEWYNSSTTGFNENLTFQPLFNTNISFIKMFKLFLSTGGSGLTFNLTDPSSANKTMLQIQDIVPTNNTFDIIYLWQGDKATITCNSGAGIIKYSILVQRIHFKEKK